MRTLGFVLHETDEYLSLTESIGPQETGGITTIPKGMILRCFNLTVEEEKR